MAIYRLPPAHRRKLRRMRALLDAATDDAASPTDGSPTPEALAEAEEYLATHSSCETYLLSQSSGISPVEPPRCAQGFGRKSKVSAPVQIRKCPICNKQKSVLSFDNELGMCIKCKYKTLEDHKSKKDSGKGKVAHTRSRKCPVCLQSVKVTLTMGDWTVEAHMKARAGGVIECMGSGKVLFHERLDAMDHTAPGSFEGGKRR